MFTDRLLSFLCLVFVARKIASVNKFAICLFEFVIDSMTLCFSLMEAVVSLTRTNPQHVLVEPGAENPPLFFSIAAFILCSTHYPGSSCHWLAIYSQRLCGEHPCPVVQRWYGLFCQTENDTWQSPWPFCSVGMCDTLKGIHGLLSLLCHTLRIIYSAGVLDLLMFDAR